MNPASSNNLIADVKGQSLIEVIVAIGIVTLVLAGLVSAVTFSLSNSQFARNKALATKYAQEGMEWLRVQRDANWYSFNQMSPDSGSLYCMSTLPATVTTLPPGVCNTLVIDDTYDIFRREVTLTGVVADDRVNITLRVWWPQGTRDSEVSVNTILTRWQ